LIIMLERETNHLFEVMATQRELVSKALQQVETALLEQEPMLRAHMTNVLETMKDQIADGLEWT